MRKKGVAIWACSPPDLDCLPVEICSMDLELRPSQFSYFYIDLKIFFKKSFESRNKQKLPK